MEIYASERIRGVITCTYAELSVTSHFCLINQSSEGCYPVRVASKTCQNKLKNM